jgi:Transglycosylase-like domain
VCAAGAIVAAPIAESRPSEQIFASADAFRSASNPAGADAQRTYQRLYTKAKRQGGDPGRNILLRGVAIETDRLRPATKAELRKSIGVLERMTATVPATSAGGVSPQLEAIAACESGGDPTAIGGGGLYRGKYQFTYETWASVGGSGDPAAAPEAEQDARAAALLARDGAGHWPVCSG